MNCKNCEINLDINDKFCAQCGAQVVKEKLTIKKVIYEFSERYLSFDNKFLTTFKTLFTHPEWVINGYLNGLRVRFVNPITYLIIAVTLSGFNIFLMKRGYLGNIDYNVFSGDQKAPIDMKEFIADRLIASLAKRKVRTPKSSIAGNARPFERRMRTSATESMYR
jgi:hypothetical protein